MNEHDIIRIAVKASMAAMGAMLAALLALFIMAAALSPDINLPGIHATNSSTRAGD